VRISGAGGQGVISAANILAKCAVSEGLYATQTQSYGPASRGGVSKGEVVISDAPIDYPFVRVPDILVVMSQEAYKSYISDVEEGTIVIIDPDLVKGEGLGVKATSAAGEAGSRQNANMVMLGALASFLDFIDTDALREEVKRRFPKGEKNLISFDAGVQIGINLGK